ncbi:hypothetical protein RN04_02645 [Arthrobacter sp. W1]|nr:hypothetical protein RN04_02645 [Arthrobacter sp. W1]
MAVKISITSDVKDVIRGADDIGDAMRDVADEMDRLGNESQAAGDNISKGLADGEGAAQDLQKELKETGRAMERAGDDGKDLGKDIDKGLEKAEKAVSSFEDDVKQAMRLAASAADKSGKKIGDDMKRGFNKAEAGASEFKDEANSTARESAASFDGSAESITDAFQEVAANAFAGFGPAGALAGLAVAAGIGVAIKAAQDLAEENNDAIGTVAELADEIYSLGGDVDRLDLGGKIREWGLQTNEDNWITFWVDEAETNFERYSRKLEGTGLDTDKIMRGMAGSSKDSEDALADLDAVMGDLNRRIEAGTTLTGRGIPIRDKDAQAAYEQKRRLDDVRDGLEDNIKSMGRSQDNADMARRATEGYTDAIESQIEALDELAGEHQSSLEANIDWQSTLAESTKTVKDNGKTLDVTTAKGRENQQALIDMAEAARDKAAADAAAGESSESLARDMQVARDHLIRTAMAAGASAEEARQLADDLGLVPHEVNTDIKADSRNARREIKEVESLTPWVDVNVSAETKPARDGIDRLDGRNVVADVFGDTRGLRGHIDNQNGRNVVADVFGDTRGLRGHIDNQNGRNVVADVFGDTRGLRDHIDNQNGRNISADVYANTGPLQEAINMKNGQNIYVDVYERFGGNYRV